MSADVKRIVTAWLKHDFWTRKQALLILSGFHPDTPIDSANNPLPNHELYLDGSRQFHMSQIHPRNIEFMQNFLNLYSYCDPDDMILGNLAHCTKKLKPSEWIEWAKSKGFTPYWLQESKLVPKNQEVGETIQSKGGKAKHQNDPKQREKLFVKGCWEKWQGNPNQYKNKTKFAQAMIEKFTPDNPEEDDKHLSSVAVITGWCTDWEKEKSQPAS